MSEFCGNHNARRLDQFMVEPCPACAGSQPQLRRRLAIHLGTVEKAKAEISHGSLAADSRPWYEMVWASLHMFIGRAKQSNLRA